MSRSGPGLIPAYAFLTGGRKALQRVRLLRAAPDKAVRTTRVYYRARPIRAAAPIV